MNNFHILVNRNDETYSEANPSDLEWYMNQKSDEIITVNTQTKSMKISRITQVGKIPPNPPKYRCADSFKLKYLELENTRMATEVQFLKEQLIEKTTLS